MRMFSRPGAEMLRLAFCCAVACTLFSVVSLRGADKPVTPQATQFFEARIRPVLAENCFKCHGQAKQKNGLRLDSRAGILTGGDQGPAIVPGEPDKSLLIKAISYADDLK